MITRHESHLPTIEEEDIAELDIDNGSGQSTGNALDPAHCAPDLSNKLPVSTTGDEYNNLTSQSPLSLIDGSNSLTTDSELDTSLEEKEAFLPGPLGNNFSSLPVTIEIFRAPHSCLTEIPAGRKDGMYYLLDNSANLTKRELGERVEIWDDCGAWKKPSCPKGLFLPCGDKLNSIVQKNGKYCVEKSIKKVRSYVPVDPQPSKTDILEVNRMYQTLKSSSGKSPFKRRITWFGNIPNSYLYLPNHVALVEYVGQYPGGQLHGNEKHPSKNKVYVKTKKSVSIKIKEQLTNNNVKHVEKVMNRQTDDDFEKQRDEKQLRNFKYSLNKKDKPNSNAADHISAVEELTKSDEYVQNVQHIKGVNHPEISIAPVKKSPLRTRKSTLRT